MKCRAEVGDRVGFETTNGEVLCSTCFFELSDPRGEEDLSGETEPKPSESHRLGAVEPFWTPGPIGDLDSDER